MPESERPAGGRSQGQLVSLTVQLLLTVRKKVSLSHALGASGRKPGWVLRTGCIYFHGCLLLGEIRFPIRIKTPTFAFKQGRGLNMDYLKNKLSGWNQVTQAGFGRARNMGFAGLWGVCMYNRLFL